MRKTVLFLLIFALIFSLCACNKPGNTDGTTAGSSTTGTTPGGTTPDSTASGGTVADIPNGDVVELLIEEGNRLIAANNVATAELVFERAALVAQQRITDPDSVVPDYYSILTDKAREVVIASDIAEILLNGGPEVPEIPDTPDIDWGN